MTTAPIDCSAPPVLILLHGAGANQAMWNAVRRHLDPRWPVVALDLPGHGSQADGHYTFEAAVETVTAAVRQAAPARVVLVGDSLGGYTSMASALVIPRERLAGLAIGGCTQNFEGKALRGLRRTALMTRVLLALFNPKKLVAKSGDKLVKKGIARADMDAMIAANLRMQGYLEAVQSIAHRDFLSKVPAIEAPILFINGDLDKGAVAHEAEFVAAARDARAQRFPCEHGVSLWMPAEFAAATNRFVDSLMAARVPA